MRKLRFSAIIIIHLSLLGATSCAHRPSANGGSQIASASTWRKHMLEQYPQSTNRVAFGVARMTAGNSGDAITAAKTQARLELLKSLRVDVISTERIGELVDATSANGEVQTKRLIEKSIIEKVAKTEIEGLETPDYFLFPDGQGVEAVAVLNLQKFKVSCEQRIRSHIEAARNSSLSSCLPGKLSEIKKLRNARSALAAASESIELLRLVSSQTGESIPDSKLLESYAAPINGCLEQSRVSVVIDSKQTKLSPLEISGGILTTLQSNGLSNSLERNPASTTSRRKDLNLTVAVKEGKTEELYGSLTRTAEAQIRLVSSAGETKELTTGPIRAMASDESALRDSLSKRLGQAVQRKTQELIDLFL
jgi:hypothetical protein